MFQFEWRHDGLLGGIQLSLSGKTVIITGAGGSIGKAAAERFYKEGCNVVATDIAFAPLQVWVSNKPNAIAVQGDVTSLDSCQHVVEEAIKKFGTIDVLVCNAGISKVGKIDELSPDMFNRIVSINVLGVYNIIKAAESYLPVWGAVVITGSKSSKRCSAGLSQYAASKHALIGLTQSLACELGERKIRVNMVCPGDLLDSPLFCELDQLAVEQGISPAALRENRINQSLLKEYCKNDDVTNAMLFLADAELSRHTTAQNIDITGGVMMN